MQPRPFNFDAVTLREAAAAVVALHLDVHFHRASVRPGTAGVLGSIRSRDLESSALVRSAGDLALEQAGFAGSSPEDGSSWARGVVKKCWPSIVQLAAELQTRRSMTRREVDMFLVLSGLGLNVS